MLRISLASKYVVCYEQCTSRLVKQDVLDSIRASGILTEDIMRLLTPQEGNYIKDTFQFQYFWL